MEEQKMQETPQVTETPFVKPVEVKKSAPVLMIVLVLLLVLSLAVSVFLGYQNMQLQKQIASIKITPTPIAYVSPSPVATDPTANWKTYSNTDFNFSFKYPSGYGSTGGVAGSYTGISKFVVSFSDSTTIREGTDAPFDGFNVYVVTDMKASDFNGFISNELVAIQNSPYGDNQKGVAKYTVSVNGVSGYYLDVNQNIRLYYFPSTDNKTVIVFSRVLANASFNDVFNQILSTFKFTQ